MQMSSLGHYLPPAPRSCQLRLTVAGLLGSPSLSSSRALATDNFLQIWLGSVFYCWVSSWFLQIGFIPQIYSFFRPHMLRGFLKTDINAAVGTRTLFWLLPTLLCLTFALRFGKNLLEPFMLHLDFARGSTHTLRWFL